jgi:isochorismate synthase
MSPPGDEAPGGRRCELVATVVPGFALDPSSLAHRGACAVFDGAHGPGDPGGGAVIAGFGEAARVVGRGETRWDAIEREASRLFARVGGPASADARLLGGVAFLPGRTAAGDDGLGDAVFVLPRWIWIDDARGARLVSIAPAAADPESLRAEAREVFGSGAGVVAAGPRASTATSIDDGSAAFVARVEAACAAIQGGLLEKVVVGRRVELDLGGPADVDAAWRSLRARESGTMRLLWRDAGATLLAASPERLVVRRGDDVVIDALAGTISRTDDDGAAIAELLASDKDRREHDVVVRTIVAAMAELGGEARHADAPVARTLRALHHLSTEVHASFASTPTAVTLAQKLHPTPAVAGTPRAAATAFLREHEAGRGWFTGAFGWFDAAGDGAFAVILRALLLRGSRAHLFAGTGIVRGSEPGRELAETEAKLRAARGALGLEARP